MSPYGGTVWPTLPNKLAPGMDLSQNVPGPAWSKTKPHAKKIGQILYHLGQSQSISPMVRGDHTRDGDCDDCRRNNSERHTAEVRGMQGFGGRDDEMHNNMAELGGRRSRGW
ncbi:hypothetical protein Q3G72_031901 [Acer saccharum]|nr:hypothetical protein Q3G72_032073 [Acer saccharum]KAK1578640.1 hypothetical protein Q3G72_031901 [Acer saccharum]